VSSEESAHQPPAAECPDCGAALQYVDTEVSSGAFRPQAAAMPQMPIHYYDCPECKTCWKLGTKLLPDPIRQILKQ
jgi:predicted nucleic acid-binding Zn ribbon protein